MARSRKKYTKLYYNNENATPCFRPKKKVKYQCKDSRCFKQTTFIRTFVREMFGSHQICSDDGCAATST